MNDTIVRLRATGGTVDIVHANQHFAPDLDGVFSIPADIATELLRMPMGLEVVPEAPAEPAPAAGSFSNHEGDK
jgi:hypothetical protein